MSGKTALVLNRFVPAATLTNIHGTVSFSYLKASVKGPLGDIQKLLGKFEMYLNLSRQRHN